jgi:hypothetical protein
MATTAHPNYSNAEPQPIHYTAIHKLQDTLTDLAIEARSQRDPNAASDPLSAPIKRSIAVICIANTSL